MSPETLVVRSLERMSDTPTNVTPLRNAAHMTAEEIDALVIDKAANKDTEIMRGADDPD